MEAVVASVTGVVGTLLGATVTYMFQRLNTQQVERIARENRLWQERMSAYSAFAGAITELLRANISLWFILHRPEDFGAQARRDAYTEADRLGSAANHARFRVRMIATDPRLMARADAAFEPMGSVRSAADQDELAWHERRCRQLVNEFVTAAGAEVH